MPADDGSIGVSRGSLPAGWCLVQQWQSAAAAGKRIAKKMWCVVCGGVS